MLFIGKIEAGDRKPKKVTEKVPDVIEKLIENHQKLIEKLTEKGICPTVDLRAIRSAALRLVSPLDLLTIIL